MAIKYSVFIFLLLLCKATCDAQDSIITPEQYIERYKGIAISEMKRTGIPASITLAQGMFESGNGNSFLARPPYNNHFGIKCKTGWTGRSVKADDDELQECFRAYDNAEDSYKDHSNFLTCEKRYAFLFDLKSTDYKGWAYGLKKAGYATNPKYPQELIARIEKYSLYQYDIGNKRMPPNLLAVNNSMQVPVSPAPKEVENSFSFKGIPAYVIKPGDNNETIADAHDMMRWEIRKYNDLKKNEVLTPGTIIYLKPKRRKGKEAFHLVKDGEGMYYVSQDEGIKLRMLYKWNRMKEGQEPAPGQQLYLRHKRVASPSLLPASTIIPRHGVMLVTEPATGPKPNFDNKCPVPSPQKDSTPNEIMQLKNVDTIVQHTDNQMDGYDSIGKYHIAQPGESIYGISKDYGLSYKKVIAWNNVSGNIKVGEKIYLSQPKGYVESKQGYKLNAVQNANPVSDGDTTTNTQTYTVKPGDTLYSISKKLNVSVSELKQWNGLTDNYISIGEKLKVGM